MQRRTVAELCLAFMFIPVSLGALYHDPSELPRSVYDYVIVGGQFFLYHAHASINLPCAAGNDGNVIASRLTENPSITVLVLEAGVR